MILCASVLLLFLGGCGVGVGRARKHPLELKVRDLEQEKAQLAGQLQQREVEIEQLKAQIEALSALPAEKREELYSLRAVKISRLTNFYDKDGDGKREKLVVYLQPIDQQGDVVKAAGVVAVQLWDLNKPGEQALLGQWQVPPDELHDLWFRSLMTGYRLTFDAPVTAEVLAVPTTVKVTFTDYLTGQTLSDQYVIEPRAD